jgi:hypothetical protein
MNECIDSTMGRIHVCLMCCLPVTIRGLVGSYSGDGEGTDSEAPSPLSYTLRYVSLDD